MCLRNQSEYSQIFSRLLAGVLILLFLLFLKSTAIKMKNLIASKNIYSEVVFALKVGTFGLCAKCIFRVFDDLKLIVFITC